MTRIVSSLVMRMQKIDVVEMQEVHKAVVVDSEMCGATAWPMIVANATSVPTQPHTICREPHIGSLRNIDGLASHELFTY